MSKKVLNQPADVPARLKEPISIEKAKEAEDVWSSRIRLASRALCLFSGAGMMVAAFYHVIFTHDVTSAAALGTTAGGLLTVALTGKDK